MSSLAPRVVPGTDALPRRPKSALVAAMSKASVPECLAAGSVTLVRAGESFGHKNVLQAAVIGILLCAILWSIPRQPRRSFANPRVALLMLLVASMGWALWRGAGHDVYGTPASAGGKAALYALVVLFGVSLIATAPDVETRDRRLVALVFALPLYAIANLFLHLAGMQNPNPAGATAGTSSQLAAWSGSAPTGRSSHSRRASTSTASWLERPSRAWES